jgi:hypothetical protein
MAAPTKAKKKAVAGPRPVEYPAEVHEEKVTDEELIRLRDEAIERAEENPDAPVEIGKRGRAGVKYVLLFTSRGREFYIAKEPSPMLVIDFLRNVRKLGRQGAVAEMAFDFAGEEVMTELRQNPEVEPEDVADVMLKIGERFFGSQAYEKIAGGAGNSQRG